MKYYERKWINKYKRNKRIRKDNENENIPWHWIYGTA
jgi:hypothetical protein